MPTFGNEGGGPTLTPGRAGPVRRRRELAERNRRPSGRWSLRPTEPSATGRTAADAEGEATEGINLVPHFGPLRMFTVAGWNRANHPASTKAIHAYLRWGKEPPRHPHPHLTCSPPKTDRWPIRPNTWPLGHTELFTCVAAGPAAPVGPTIARHRGRPAVVTMPPMCSPPTSVGDCRLWAQ